MAYRVEFAPHAQRQFGALPKDIQRRLQSRIDVLIDHPRPSGIQKLKGSGNTFRLRVGDYRIVYEIYDDILLVLVVQVGHRRDVYRRL